MDIYNDKKKLTVTKMELESKIRSKTYLHYILRQGCQRYEFTNLYKDDISSMNEMFN